MLIVPRAIDGWVTCILLAVVSPVACSGLMTFPENANLGLQWLDDLSCSLPLQIVCVMVIGEHPAVERER